MFPFFTAGSNYGFTHRILATVFLQSSPTATRWSQKIGLDETCWWMQRWCLLMGWWSEEFCYFSFTLCLTLTSHHVSQPFNWLYLIIVGTFVYFAFGYWQHLLMVIFMLWFAPNSLIWFFWRVFWGFLLTWGVVLNETSKNWKFRKLHLLYFMK